MELSSLLDDLATLVEPVFIAGDINNRFDWPDDVSVQKLNDSFEAYDLTYRVNEQTHDRNGLLDVIPRCNDIAAPEVDVIDIGFFRSPASSLEEQPCKTAASAHNIYLSVMATEIKQHFNE